ncbi:hypothetical protein AAMO2058_000588200 [Amorphochlora amoebiformis]
MATSSAKPNPDVLISTDLVKKIFENTWREIDTKATKDGTTIASHLINHFLEEAIKRSARVAGSSEVQTKHIEMILPQLLLDF